MNPISDNKSFRILYYPILSSVVLFILMGIISFYTSQYYMRLQLSDSGKEYAELISENIEKELVKSDILIDSKLNQLISIGNYLTANKHLISNDYLTTVADNFKIDRVYSYDNSGKVLYSANSRYIGWTPKPGDPIDSFIKSNKDVFIEEIRKSTETDELFRFVYIRDVDGSFIQLGYALDTIELLTSQYKIQSVIERIKSHNDNIVYIQFIDNSMINISDTNIALIGKNSIDEITYDKAVSGLTTSNIDYSDDYHMNLLKIVSPVKEDNVVIGVVSIGYSIEDINTNSIVLESRILIIAVTSLIIQLVVIKNYVINPIKDLKNNIDKIRTLNFLNNGLKSSHQSNGTIHAEVSLESDPNKDFFGVYSAIIRLIERNRASNLRIEKLSDEIFNMAYKDSLTNLPNRFSLKDEFENLVESEVNIAVLLVDLNNFKEVNDTRGHSFGDDILRALGKKLINQTSSEKFFISRYGGDEFIILINYNDENDLKSLLLQICNLFNTPIKVNSEQIDISASIGYSLCPDDSDILGELISKSDIAMYVGKNKKITTPIKFHEDMYQSVYSRKDIKKHINECLKNDTFALVYQPIYCLKSNKPVAYEALIRMTDNKYSPDQFIPIAEETGQIIELGRWVIKNVILALSMQSINADDMLPININFSTKQFMDETLHTYTMDLLEAYDVNPRLIKFEITETSLIEKEIGDLIPLITNLKEVGIEILLDDFGAGYSSIFFVTQFPLDIIKLDKGFISTYMTESNFHIFKTWVELVHTYGYQIIAEGIEEQYQVDMLVKLQVEYAQGYLFGKPMPLDL